MSEAPLSVELAKRLNAIVENSSAAFILNHAMAIERQALEHEVLRLRSVNGELHGQIGMLAARVEELEASRGDAESAETEKQEEKTICK